MTVFWKTDHLDTRTEIHLLPVRDRHTHALSRNTKHLTIDCQVCFYTRIFTDAVKPRGCISWCWGALIGLHGVSNCSSRQSGPLVDCISSCHLLKAQHCPFSPNGCFTPPLAPHPPPPPTPSPSHPTPLPPPIDSIRDITGTEINCQKPAAFK